MIETYTDKLHAVEKKNVELRKELSKHTRELLKGKKFLAWLIEEMATVDRYFDRGETLKEILDYVLFEKTPWKNEDE